MYYNQALTLNDDPIVSFAFPPVGLHRIVLNLIIQIMIPFALNDSLCMTENSR